MKLGIDSFFEEAQKLAQIFDEWAGKYKLPAVADHICYKCGDYEEFAAMRKMFEGESRFIYQSIISGRPIAVIKFLRPVSTCMGDIWYLELAAQKPDGSQVSGFDHVEIYPLEGTMEDLAQRMMAQGVRSEKVVRPHHTTYDGIIEGRFKIRLEDEALVAKIKRDEM
ncbi:TPA: hypothetical protein DEP96_01115 [Candidatus Uhrbacteria bacterium]|nr:hypothetical protein [Candidatus Uhrbacteria bacterium]